jgi:hypothetical protein
MFQTLYLGNGGERPGGGSLGGVRPFSSREGSNPLRPAVRLRPLRKQGNLIRDGALQDPKHPADRPPQP